MLITCKNMRVINKMNLVKISYLIILLNIVSACGRGEAYLLPPQTWNNTEFMVEIRPGAPSKGMNEFVVLSTQTDGVPGYNYIITLSTDLNDKASQMIQDGRSGVYRRAIEVTDPLNEVLIVHIADKKEVGSQTELRFPLAKHL